MNRTATSALEQSVLEIEPGGRRERATGEGEETLFVVSGSGVLALDGESHALEPETGACLAPGEAYTISAIEPLRIVSVRIPAPDTTHDELGPRQVTRRLSDQAAHAATTEREFRIVADPSSGLCSATHFVGYIPTARAPEHFHSYDEVIYVLDGEGIFHAGEIHQQLQPGSCIELPARTIHCIENTGQGMMRVVAVFRPAGSPAAAYYPDGTRAYQMNIPEEEFSQ